MISRAARAFTAATGAGLSLAIAAALLLGWLTEEVLEGDAAHFDASLRALIHARASPRLTDMMWFFTDLGSVTAIAGILVAVLALFWFCHWWRAAAILAITMAGSTLLVEVLKLSFHRARPVPYFAIAAPHSFSYPSGHSLSSFALFGTVAWLVTAHVARRWISVLIWFLAVAIIGLVGLSRAYLGVHYPTDILAGYLTAFIWIMAVRLGDRLYLARAAGFRGERT